MLATAATVIPQIGSTASGGAGAGAGSGARGARAGSNAAVCFPRRTADHGREDRERDLGRRLGADVDAGGHVDAIEVLLGNAVGTQVGEHARAALAAGHEGDVRNAGLEPAAKDVQLVAAVRRDDEREIALRRLGTPALHRDDVQPELRAERSHRAPPIGVSPTTRTRGRGEQRLEEHLDRATGQARVLDRRRSLLVGSLPTDAVLLAGRSVGKYPQQQRLSALDRQQGVRADALLRAHAAHEALDRAVVEHERDVARLHARRALRANDRGDNERRALRCELLRPRRHGADGHWGGSARPCIAAQTRAGVQGMSMWSTP